SRRERTRGHVRKPVLVSGPVACNRSEGAKAEIPVERATVDAVLEGVRLVDEALLVEVAVLRLQLIGRRCEREICCADHIGVGRPVRMQVLSKGIQSYRKALAKVD